MSTNREDGRMAVLDTRAPAALHDAVRAFAETTGMSRSEAHRHALCRGLEVLGLWPPERSEVSSPKAA